MNCFYKIPLILLLLTISIISSAQELDTINSIKRKKIYYTGLISSYTASITFLYFSWYKSYDKTSFHFFDDSEEWMQMDKAGHFYTSYQLNKAIYNSMLWSGYNKKTALILSSIKSFLMMNSIEIFDSFSKKWGFSVSDVFANTAGIATSFIEKKYSIDFVSFKFSFHYTNLPNLRSEALGKNKIEQIIKDYNGQTYWISLNFSDILNYNKLKWINISFGYSAYNMIYARTNDQVINNLNIDYSRLLFDKIPYRRFFVSLDINPKHIKVKNKLIGSILKTFNFIKFPFPTLEINKYTTKFHIIYF